MIDIISLSIAIGGIMVALATHIKFSRCMGFEIKTRNIQKDSPSPPDTPNDETTLLVPSTPIPIPTRPKVKKNYL